MKKRRELKVIPPYKIVIVRTYILNFLTHCPPRAQTSRTAFWSSISIGRGHSTHIAILSCASYMWFKLTRACNLTIWKVCTQPFQLIFMLLMIQTTHCISVIGMSKVMGPVVKDTRGCMVFKKQGRLWLWSDSYLHVWQVSVCIMNKMSIPSLF